MNSLHKSSIPYAVLALALVSVACNQTGVPTVQAANGNAASAPLQNSESDRIREVLAPGTVLHVRLQEAIDTQRNRAGDHFSATLDEPIVEGDRVIIPKGTTFAGHVVSAKRSGRFKGRAELALSLDSFGLNGHTYEVQTSNPVSVSSRHRKRNLLWIGGGSGAGAAIGAAAGGGVGALIGAGAGAGAGTVGAAITGRKDVRLPVESRITFKLTKTVTAS